MEATQGTQRTAAAAVSHARRNAHDPEVAAALRVVQVPRRFVRSHWGGTETVVLETSRQLQSLGHRVDILCPEALADRRWERIGDVDVRRVPYFYPYIGLGSAARRRLDQTGGNMFSFSLLQSLLRLPGLDLIHLHTAKRVGGIARTAARRRNIPYVVSLHGGLLDVPAAESQRLVQPTRGAWEWGRALGWMVGSRRVLDDAAAILCVSPEEQRRVRERYPDKRVELFPNGVDAARFEGGDGRRFRSRYGLSAEARVVLTVARVDPQKNQALALQALPELLRAEPRLHLVLVGPETDDAYAASLRRRVRESGLQDHVLFTGGLDAESGALADAYHGADLFLLPSAHEPFGIAVLEAWAAGLAVVASRVGGVPAVVTHGETGLLFEPGDAAGLATAVRACLAAPELAGRLAAAGQRRALTEYAWPQLCQRLEGLYRELTRAHRGRPAGATPRTEAA